MSGVENSRASAVADLAEGQILRERRDRSFPGACFPSTGLERGLRVVGPTRRLQREESGQGDVRVGGRWRASGMDSGRPYVIEGEFLEVDPPRKLVHTWHSVGAPGKPATVTYLLEPLNGETRITLRHSGLAAPGMCINTCIGWETSFERLAEILEMERAEIGKRAAAGLR